MPRRPPRAVSAVAPLLLAACSAGPPRELHVLSYTPRDTADRQGPIELRFDRPVVDDAQVGKPAATDVLALTPAVPWRGFWQDRQTLVVEPTNALAPSTRYEVALRGDLARRTHDFRFAFVHRPLAVEGVWGIPATALPPDGTLPLSFNQPVRALDAAAHCRLAARTGDVALLAVDPSQTATKLELRPARTLPPGASYTLTCADLHGAGGDAPLPSPYALALRVRPTFEVAHVLPSGEAVGADQVDLTVAFTTPVALDAARKAITAAPAIAKLDDGELSADGTTYHATVDLEVGTSYAITVGALTDTYGQRLTTPATATFHTGDAQPRLSMERGIFAVEASAPGYPMWSRNLAGYQVTCGAIPRGKLVAALTTDMNYDPWGGNNDSQPIGWDALAIKPRTRTAKLTAPRNAWHLEQLDLGAACAGRAHARGVYLAEVSSDDVVPDNDHPWRSPRKNRVFANVTDLGVLLKVGTASGVAWVTSLATGAPVDGAQVTLYTPQGAAVWRGTTDGDGLARIPGSELLKRQPAKGATPEESEDWDSYRAQRLIAVVEKAGDLAVVDGNWSNGIQIWNFGLPEDRGGGQARIRGFLQSDRGLYRPGESVHWKGLVRELRAGLPPRVPARAKVDVTVTDSRGAELFTKTLPLSSFGGFAFDLDLPADAAVGDGYVEAKVAGQTFRDRFGVEEFRPTTFEVGLKSTGDTVHPGDRLGFDLAATYLFGAPVEHGKVEWTLRRRPHPLRFVGFDDYTFSADPRQWWWASDRDDYGEEIGDGKGETDGHGHLAIAARDPSVDDATPAATTSDAPPADDEPALTRARPTGPVDYILAATVTDSSDQAMHGQLMVTAHAQDLYLGMHANESVQAVGMPFGVNLVALRPDGSRTAARGTLTWTRAESRCAWQTTTGRAFQQCTAASKTEWSRDVAIAAGGSTTERVYPTAPGEYTVKLATVDGHGHPVEVASEIWVLGKGEAFWSGDEGDRMSLVASKPAYHVGDTARLVPQANLVAPTALITIERDGVLDARVARLGAASEGITLTIADAWAPNVFASVALVSGRSGPGDRGRPQFKMGEVELKVSAQPKQLDVAVELEKAVVLPGEQVHATVRVTHAGAPVAAEVALSVADEGVLQLIAYQTPNPMITFYAAYGLGVDAATNWNRIARLADPEAGDPDQGGDHASRLKGQRVRATFLAQAYWRPMLVTDALGEIHVSFKAPDNLTAFRLMAVAADRGDQFGAGERRLTVNKPLMLQPTLPRLLRAADAASIGVIVHNGTGKAGKATVTATARGGAQLLGQATATIDLPEGGEAPVRFAARANLGVSATFGFAVSLGDAKDAVEVTVPIEQPRRLETQTLVATTLAPGATWQGQLDAPKDVLPEESAVVITVDRAGLGELTPSLRYLIEYPYGCLEQTLSRVIPLVAIKDLARSLDDPALAGGKLPAFVEAGVAKILRHQQGDGHFSLWPQSQTYPHLTAYALWGLTVAETAGVKVPAKVFDDGLAALTTWASRTTLTPDGDAATLAMAAYVMALRGHHDPALTARLYQLRAGLPRWGQAFLLRAIALGKGDATWRRDLERLLVDGAVVHGDQAMIREAGMGAASELTMNSDVRASAMTLAALLEVDPQAALIDPLARGLAAERGPDGRWTSTQDNLWALVALAAYARRTAATDTTVTITVDGKPALTRTLHGGAIATLRLPLTKARGPLAVKLDQGGHLTVRATLARVDDGRAERRGFTVTRRYLDATGTPLTQIPAGTVVTVELTVHADADRRWIAVTDPLPAGLEPVNPATAGVAGTPDDPNARTPWNAVWVHHELRDDRARWFADLLPSGTQVLTYQARATTPGTFAAPPATVEAMYAPDARGRCPATLVTVTK